MIHGSSIGKPLPMLMACNIAAWQSSRTPTLGSNFASFHVWAHLPAQLFIACAAVEQKNSRQNCRGAAASPRKVFRDVLAAGESLSRLATMI
jgi:hypothetical protein